MGCEPFVSVGMPVFNSEKTVAEAIRSIINQNFNDWELLVIDDGSNDGTLEIVRAFRDSRIRTFSDGRNLRLPARLNEAIALSRGKYFARMDGDDIAYPERLRIQTEFLEVHPEVDLVGSSVSIFRGSGELHGWRPAYATHDGICGGVIRTFSLAHVSWMGRREWFQRNPYDPTKFLAQDRDLLIRSHRHSHFAAVPDVLVGVREDLVPLRKMRRAHFVVASALAKDAIRNKDGKRLLSAMIEAAKPVVDAVAVGTGLNYRVLKHRARPIDVHIVDSWQRTWSGVQTKPTFE